MKLSVKREISEHFETLTIELLNPIFASDCYHRLFTGANGPINRK